MKKLFTLLTATAMSLTAMATDYTDQLSITLNGGDPTTSTATVTVTKEEGSNDQYTIVLNDFSFSGMKIGDVTMTGVVGYQTDLTGDWTVFSKTEQDAAITNGGLIASALGGKVHVTINDSSCMKSDKLYLSISLPVSVMGNTFDVAATFGTNPVTKTSYTDNLVVTVMGQTLEPQQNTIDVEKLLNGNHTLTLKNFSLTSVMDVGTIELTNVESIDDNGTIKLQANDTVMIQNGDDNTKTWGLAGQSVPVKLEGTMTTDKLAAKMTITYAMSADFSMDIIVVFGNYESAISLPTTTGKTTTAIYDLSGRKLNAAKSGVNIMRKADGTSVKVLKK